MHEKFMKEALELAKNGYNNVSTNPMVGAILVYENEIIGRGFHQKYGEAHAEVNAINDVHEKDVNKIAQSTLYVTLEPCCHTGKTPPCTSLILEKNIPKVVVAMQDPNTLVAGKGIDILRKNGVHVLENILENEAKELNQKYIFALENKKPFVILKWAEDENRRIGNLEKRIKITTDKTDNITSEWRAEVDAILIGARTFEVDNPRLYNISGKGKQPIRLLLANHINIDPSKHFFDDEVKTIIFNNEKNETFKNIEWIKCNTFDLEEVLDLCFSKNIHSIIVEGGATVLENFINKNLFQEIRQIKSTVSTNATIAAPTLPLNIQVYKSMKVLGDQIFYYSNQNL